MWTCHEVKELVMVIYARIEINSPAGLVPALAIYQAPHPYPGTIFRHVGVSFGIAGIADKGPIMDLSVAAAK